MPVVRIETFIQAPPERCFDLARDVDLHLRSTHRTHERAVAGVTSGFLELGDTVTFEAVHFGVRQRLTARITRFEPPHLFVDEMLSGAFARLVHTHEFLLADGGTLMRDTFDYTSPLGLLGRLADVLFLERYLRHFLRERNDAIKAAAEAPSAGAS